MECLRPRLLVVDDEAAIRFALSEYFRESGWSVDAEAEKEEAEALLACTEYEVVIADLRLTGIYGVEGLDIIRGHQGTVLLEVLVDRKGGVQDLRVLQSSRYTTLDDAALASVKNWSFEPGTKGSRPIDMWVRLPVRFQLK